MKKIHWIKLVGITLGAMAGFAYYHFIGCRSGSCPISGNPWISTAYGGLVGYLLIPAKSKSEKITTERKE